MRYYTKRKNSETICIDKIKRGISSIKNNHRKGDEVGKDLEFFFNKLKEINEPMYDEWYLKYCLIRMEVDKDNDSVTIID